MTVRDQLTRDERIRLEALAQSIVASGMSSQQDDVVLRRTKRFEAWIREGVIE